MYLNQLFDKLFTYGIFLFLFLSFVQFKMPFFEALQLNYLLLLALFALGVAYSKYLAVVLLDNKILLLLLVTLLFYFAWGVLHSGFRSDNIRVFILMISFVVGVYSFAIVGYEKFINLFIPLTAWLVLLTIAARVALYPQDFYDLVTINRFSLSDDYPFLVTGGHNIEVSFILLLAALIPRRSLFIVMFSIGIFYSLLYESRAGLLIGLLIILYRNDYLQFNLKKILWASLGIATLLGIMQLAQVDIMTRFFDLEKELYYGEQGIGRIGFYYGAYLMFVEHLYGVGIGNAVYAMGDLTGMAYVENNVHNIYLQFFLDAGFVGFFGLLFVAVHLMLQAIKHQQDFIPGGIVLIFFVIGLIQFTGYDSIAWFFIGFFVAYLHNQKEGSLYAHP